MSEQDNLRIIRQGWDAWNAHDVEAALKVLDEKHVWETDTLPRTRRRPRWLPAGDADVPRSLPGPALFNRPATL